MYSPCFDCLNRTGQSYTEACNNTCEYANVLSRLKPYGSIDEIIAILKGDSFPVVFVDKEHIEFTDRIVQAAKEGLI
jgi:hypothetical protein